DIGNGLAIGTQNSTPIIMGTNNTNRLHIDGSTGAVTIAGNVGIGAATPTQELTVKSRSNNGNVVEIQNSSASSTTIFRIFETVSGDGLFSVFTNTGAEVMRLTSVNNGRMAMGCNLPEHTLDLGNAIGAPCSTS